MKNKPFRTLLKAWITAASLGAFFFGWSILGHSGKPVAATSAVDSTSAVDPQVTPLPTLAPLPAIGSSQSLQPLPQQSLPSFSFQPRFRTRGS